MPNQEDSEATDTDSLHSEVATPTDSDLHPKFIVGIGASAGGLDALTRFFEEMQPVSGLAFVVVQHLSPDFKSLMDRLLARHTSMAIHRVEQEMQVEADSIYLIPPKKNMVLEGGQLKLTAQDFSSGVNLPINVFFRSLAADAGTRAIAIVLSGTGSDGSNGIIDVHENGGLVIVQQEESAQFDGMPRNAIDTGLVDLILPPEKISEAILQHTGNADETSETQSAAILNDPESPGLAELFMLLRQAYGIDFTHYKAATIDRRIERRITMSRCHDLEEYVTFLRENSDEVSTLYKDLLIGVTRFFRDPEAFEVLQREVVEPLVRNSKPDQDIRIWVAGCASGEEAYSLAIAFSDECERQEKTTGIRIFATDVHPESLARAAAGLFSESSVEGMDQDRLDRHFTRRGDWYQVSRQLRGMIMFSSHNVTRDAPFTRIDLVSCRNMLIYLREAAQRKAIAGFHFSLNVGAALFLGPSESLAGLDDEFETVDRKAHVYRKTRDTLLPEARRLSLQPLPVKQSLGNRSAEIATEVRNDLNLLRTYDSLLQKHMPPGLLVDQNHDLVHVFGDAGRFLNTAQGRTTLNVLDMVNDDLRLAMSAALNRVYESEDEVIYKGVRVTLDDHLVHCRLTAESVPGGTGGASLALITMDVMDSPKTLAEPPVTNDSESDGEVSDRLTFLEYELQYTRDNLHAAIEELETYLFTGLILAGVGFVVR